MGSRIAGLYLLGVTVATVLSRPKDHLLAWSFSVLTVGLSTAAIARVLARPVRPAAALSVALCLPLTMTVLVRADPGLSAHDAQVLVGSVASAAAAGAALSWGPSAGLAVTAWALACWALPARLLAPLEGASFVGALVGGLLGATASFLLRRGFVVTQRALVAAEEAVTARVVAAAQWRTRRNEIRTLHDTVLSTLSLLAQGGQGIDPAVLRGDCAAQARFLRESELRESELRPPAVDEADLPPGEGLADPFTSLRHRWAMRSLQVQLYGSREAMTLAGLAPASVTALLAAVEECLENVRRHAAVTVASVVVLRRAGAVRCVVTDEGRGFRAWDDATHGIGLRESVVGRIREHGGSVRLWSAPGRGTSVALVMPCPDVPTAPEPPR